MNREYHFIEGGPDHDPIFYRELPGPRTTYYDTNRTRQQLYEYFKAVAAGLPIIGVCGGAQLIGIANGCKLIQHIEGHAIGGTHSLRTNVIRPNQIKVQANSTHHQCIDVSSLPEYAELIACDVDSAGIIVPEIVWFPETRSLAIQGHPEYSDAPPEYKEYCNQLIETLLDIKGIF